MESDSESLESKAKELFQLCDVTKSGLITLQDLKRVNEDLSIDENQLRQIFGILDTENQGNLTLQEFTKAFGHYVRHFTENKKSENTRSRENNVFYSVKDCLIAETSPSLSPSSSNFELEKVQIDELVHTLQRKLSQEQADKRLLEAALAQRDRKHNSELSALLAEAEEQVYLAKRRRSSDLSRNQWVPVEEHAYLLDKVRDLADAKEKLLNEKDYLQKESRRLSCELVGKEVEMKSVKETLKKLERSGNLENIINAQNDTNNNKNLNLIDSEADLQKCLEEKHQRTCNCVDKLEKQTQIGCQFKETKSCYDPHEFHKHKPSLENVLYKDTIISPGHMCPPLKVKDKSLLENLNSKMNSSRRNSLNHVDPDSNNMSNSSRRSSIKLIAQTSLDSTISEETDNADEGFSSMSFTTGNALDYDARSLSSLSSSSTLTEDSDQDRIIINHPHTEESNSLPRLSRRRSSTVDFIYEQNEFIDDLLIEGLVMERQSLLKQLNGLKSITNILMVNKSVKNVA